MLRKERKWNIKGSVENHKRQKNGRQKQEQRIRTTYRKLTNVVDVSPTVLEMALNVNG